MMAVRAKSKKVKKSNAKKSKPTSKAAARTKAGARATSKPTPIPPGYNTITPHLVVKGGKEAIAFYKAAFGAKDKGTMMGPDGKVMHSSLQFGNSMVMLNDEMMGAKSPTSLNGTPITVHLYVNNADVAWKKALSAGAKEIMPLQDQFWGDRYGIVEDPFGHRWSIASRIEILTAKDINKRVAKMGGGPPKGDVELEAEAVMADTRG
jgi:uncharacterized glyoxalase superfamily protein PhnB